ncbi:hypothetical protein KDK95_06355 [Actinospica sp. MGRD01-02]|uniref:Uncharacterized protein n=1 Tax=Actinospica acidithermotolerans TaxID=2828514 RepID=A0A941E8I2_9ACTN|nr:hypothetical protein [Actinospica acidithermotolerans]MBR7825923.1 hypothetical protein [Actinospica acidithermotolerans]
MNTTTRLELPPLEIRRRHAVHGLVAIANGPDYCLCGNLWPCRPSAESAG